MKRTRSKLNAHIPNEERTCCCKRSTCRKKYCECFRLNKLCTNACKCVGCLNKVANFDENTSTLSFPDDTAQSFAIVQNSSTPQSITELPVVELTFQPIQGGIKAALKDKQQKKKILKERINRNPPIVVKEPTKRICVNGITPELIDSCIKCMLTQAKECIDCDLNDWQTEKMIIDEFENCLNNIIKSMGLQTNNEEQQQQQYETESNVNNNVMPSEAENLIENTDPNAAFSLSLEEIATLLGLEQFNETTQQGSIENDTSNLELSANIELPSMLDQAPEQ